MKKFQPQRCRLRKYRSNFVRRQSPEPGARPDDRALPRCDRFAFADRRFPVVARLPDVPIRPEFSQFLPGEIGPRRLEATDQQKGYFSRRSTKRPSTALRGIKETVS